MDGGADNDTYIVDNSSDVINEAANAGTDTVLSSVSYTIADADVENLTLTDAGSDIQDLEDFGLAWSPTASMAGMSTTRRAPTSSPIRTMPRTRFC